MLAELTRLRQIALDPSLVFENYKGGAEKLGAIMELVDEAADAGRKVLVFSQFTSYLDVLSAELDRRGIAHFTITGATPKRERVRLVNQFNDDETPVFLVSLKAGGTGLNLTGASVVVHADRGGTPPPPIRRPTAPIASGRAARWTCTKWWPRAPSRSASWPFRRPSATWPIP